MTEPMIDTKQIAKEKNRLKQAKFYEANKQRVNEQRKLKRQALKELQPPKPQSIKPLEPIEPIQVEPIEIIIKKSQKKTIISLDDLANAIKNLKELNIIKTTGTMGLYINTAKQLQKLLNITDFNKDLKKFTLVMDKIDNSDYSINMKKNFYQFIVYIIDTIKLKYTPRVFGMYKDKFNAYKLKSLSYTEEKNKEEIISFSAYLQKVKEHFGVDSKMYNLISLYGIENTFRDNFQLEIVSLVKDAQKDTSKNYFVQNIKGHCFLIINDYKTQLYGQQKIKLNQEISNKMETYIEKNNLKVGDYLFGKSKLGPYISKQNKEIGIHGSIDLIRKMKYSEEKDKGLTEEQQVELAKKFQHSVSNAQINYGRQIKKEES